jgi:hypothetical protein
MAFSTALMATGLRGRGSEGVWYGSSSGWTMASDKVR